VAAVRQYAPIALGHRTLHRDGATHHVHDAQEFNQHAVTGRLDDAATVFVDRGIDHGKLMRLQLRVRAPVVEAHELAIASDIGRENGREAADSFFGHSIQLLSENAMVEIVLMPLWRAYRTGRPNKVTRRQLALIEFESETSHEQTSGCG
jgi:hypothetical protein